MAEPPQTPSRINKRTRYNTDVETLNATTNQEQQEQSQNNENGKANLESQPRVGGRATEPSIQTELDQTRRLIKVFEVIDSSMTEARDKLKTFYKTADETNTLLDMWVRVLSQTEHTQKLLQDPAWEGQTLEEIRDKEYQERRAAYHLAMEEENNYRSHGNTLPGSFNHSTAAPATTSTSSSSAPFYFTSDSSLPSQTLSGGGFGSTHSSNTHHFSSNMPLKKSNSALVAAAHAHASAIAARKRNAAGANSAGGSGIPKAITSTTSVSIK
ncbi:hypothetical protein BGZ76_011167 [Entomortierella beljakovae]|nr:hypothetical protein BGZ76_011167 [Entomortierella beljakovae]